MGKLKVFNHVSLDGYFVDRDGDMGWAHRSDPEWDEFASGNAQQSNGVLLFGRVTYEMMASFWPTAAAKKSMPEVAAGMNNLPKVVFSKTLKRASWKNTRVVSDLVEGVRALKKEYKDLVILGSGQIVSKLTEKGLVDEYQLVVNPIVLGKGRTLFEGVKQPVGLKLTATRAFKIGNVVLTYGRA